MKRIKAMLAVFLILALLTALFTACADNSNPSASNPDQVAGTTFSSGSTEAFSPEEYLDVVMYYFDLRNSGAEHGQHIEDAINAHIAPNYGLKVDITWLSAADWIGKMQLKIASGDRIDVLPLCANSGVQALYARSMVMDITDYMAEFAPETLDLMAPYIDAYRYNGRLYGVPTLRGYVANQYILMRQDILEELGLEEKANSMTCWTDFEEILAAVSEAYDGSGLYALGNSASSSYGFPCGRGVISYENFSDTSVFDVLGDSLEMTYSDQEGHVSWIYDQPQVEKNFARIASWQQNGWASPETALNNNAHGDELIKQGVQFASLQGSEYGVEAVKSASTGYPITAVMHTPGMIKTSTLTTWGIGVSTNADEPEGACKLINVLYTDAYVMNLLTRGEEGVDYELVDNECVYRKEAGTYYYEADFLIGNNLLTHPVEGQGADYYDQIQELNATAKVSSYLGFVFDNSEYELHIANITAVKDQFDRDLNSGNYTPELYAEAKSKYEAAGIYEYLNEIQAQLDAWLAETK